MQFPLVLCRHELSLKMSIEYGVFLISASVPPFLHFDLYGEWGKDSKRERERMREREIEREGGREKERERKREKGTLVEE